MAYITKDPKEHLKVRFAPLIQVLSHQSCAAILNPCELQALNGFLKQSDGRDKLTAAVQVTCASHFPT